MKNYVNRTGEANRVSGVYHSQCHNAERTVLERQPFPRCGYCNSNTSWTLSRALKARPKSTKPSRSNGDKGSSPSSPV